ncbi:MAG TPA: RagB/SusD family nutrient uptake outer membrane protein, partial [Flavitalea sp.]|nr:RagB/SusD family nutrient uptake outer membrane protein [Flavitalea sp.]
GRPNKGAAKGLLAKAYLTMATAPMNATENYAKAAQAAKDVMDDGAYTLIPDIHDVFKSENKYASEKLWSFNANYNYLVVEGETWSPSEMDGWNDLGADPRMDTLWPDQPRKDAYFLTTIDGKNYSELSSQRPTCRKWLPPNISESDYQNWTNAANCPIIRYADVLLIYAEAENKANNGPTQAACDAVNQVVDRANGNVVNAGHPKFTTALSVDEFDKRVIMERNWELCFEFDRWFDLVRKRILPENSPKYTQNFSEDDYLFPIPENDLRLNQLLTQNPGYPTP